MDIDTLVNSIQEQLSASPFEQRETGLSKVADSLALVPWNWILVSLVELLQRYPSGLTRPVILNELQQAWDTNYGSAWSATRHPSSSTQIREIFDSGSLVASIPIECEIRGVRKLENSKETWVAQLGDPGSDNEEALHLDWLLHHKYHALMPNSADTLKRSSSRGFLHTLARAKSMKSYTAAPLFEPGRKLQICSPQLHHAWNRTPPTLSLLPAEDVVIILRTVQESEQWEDHHINLTNFKAHVLSIPSSYTPTLQSNEYIRPSPVKENSSKLDIILGSGSDSQQPIAVLRLTGAHRQLSLCFKEGDIVCLQNAHLVSASHPFTSSGSVYSSKSVDEAEVAKLQYKLPLYSYESDTLLKVLPKEATLAPQRMDVTRDELDSSTAHENADSSLYHATNFRFHGPKVSPVLLQPYWSNITMVGYVTRIEPPDVPKHGFRRFGFRLKDTNTGNTCDVTTWEPLDVKKSMVADIRLGHLILVRGVWTVLRKRDNRLLANITQNIGQIVNISTIEGFLASHPDIGPPGNINSLLRPPTASSSPYSCGILTSLEYGPFPILGCTLSPSTMSFPVVLRHNTCHMNVRNAPSPSTPIDLNTPLTSPVFCEFCRTNVVNWNVECSWQFEVEWNLESDRSSVIVLAAPNVSEKLLNTTASEYLQLSAPEKDMLALTKASDPAKGRVFVTRSPDARLRLDLFISDH